MTERATEKTVTFKHAFTLPSAELTLPAGDYRVTTYDEMLSAGSRLVWRRLSTTITAPALGSADRLRQETTIDPAELSASLAADTQQGPNA